MVYPGVQINYGCRIDAFAVLNMNCAIGHDCTIGAFTSLAPGVSLGGHTGLGEQVEMGINSCTIQGMQVGAGSVVGAGAAVVRDVPAGAVAVGVPAVVRPQGIRPDLAPTQWSQEEEEGGRLV